jgi:GH25 family lysozyme M1 (1,4-beta-N-acetylmuramidase)
MDGYVNMIDVSKWQGVIDWPAVLADPFDVKVVALRATLGHTYRDSQYVNNMRALRPFDNVLKGAYHVLTPDVSADAHLRHIEDTLRDAPPVDFNVIDVELDKGWSPETIAKCFHDVAVGVEELGFKHKVMCYTADWFWTPKVGGIPLSGGSYKPNAEDWALWVAHYYGLARPPRLPIGWSQYFAWQYSDKGSLAGINAQVDLNIMKESYYKQLGGVITPPPPPPPSGEWKDLQVKGEVRII